MELVRVNSSNWEKAAELTTNEDGIPTLYEKFIAGNACSILESIYEKGWQSFIIEENNTPVGFTMFGFNEKEGFYEICRLMIDFRHQGRGLGRKALRLIIKKMCEEFSPKEIYISSEKENERAIALYKSEGFLDTGLLLSGEKLLRLKSSI